MRKIAPDKVETFIQLVGRGMGLAKAALECGIGNTKSSANVMSWRLMKDPDVRRRVEEIKGTFKTKCDVAVAEAKKAKSKVQKGDNRKIELATALFSGKEARESVENAVGRPVRSQAGMEASLVKSARTIVLIKEILDARGVDEDFLTTKLLEGLEATKPVVVSGAVTDYPDYSVRGNYMHMALKLRGHLMEKKESTNAAIIVRLENGVKNAMTPQIPQTIIDVEAINVQPEEDQGDASRENAARWEETAGGSESGEGESVPE